MLRNNREDLRQITVQHYANEEWRRLDEIIASEASVTVSWNNGGSKSTLWTWPFSLECLAVGHALLEQTDSATRPAGYTATVTKAREGLNGYSCSVALQPEKRAAKTPAELPPVKADALLQAMKAFIENNGLWHATGCFHRAGIFSPAKDSMLYATEDIGRHNCVDRLAGWALLRKVSLSDCILFLSARVTASICTKAIKAGFRFITSCSAVSSTAVDMAQEHGVTLVGFTRHRENRLSLYTAPGGKLILE